MNIKIEKLIKPHLLKMKVYEPVDPPEVLAQKILAIEHRIYPEVIKAYCEDRIIFEKNKPIIEVIIEN